MNKHMKNKMNYNLIIGIAITGAVLILAFLSFFWTPYDPTGMDAALKTRRLPGCIFLERIILAGIFSVV